MKYYMIQLAKIPYHGRAEEKGTMCVVQDLVVYAAYQLGAISFSTTASYLDIITIATDDNFDTYKLRNIQARLVESDTPGEHQHLIDECFEIDKPHDGIEWLNMSVISNQPIIPYLMGYAVKPDFCKKKNSLTG